MSANSNLWTSRTSQYPLFLGGNVLEKGSAMKVWNTAICSRSSNLPQIQQDLQNAEACYSSSVTMTTEDSKSSLGTNKTFRSDQFLKITNTHTHKSECFFFLINNQNINVFFNFFILEWITVITYLNTYQFMYG